MPGPAPKPASQRRTRHKPQRGEWKATPGIGWQHGEIPAPPDGLMAESREAWAVWMRSWFAAHWTPDDLPGLRLVIRQYDAHHRNPAPKANDATAVVRLMDTYGITPAGQQSRRWEKPEAEPEKAPVTKGSRYAHLRAVG